MTEHRPGNNPPAPARNSQSSWRYALIRFSWCLLGYLAGCIASAVWFGLVVLVDTNGAGPGSEIWGTMFLVGLFTGAYAFPAAPSLILFGEIMRIRVLPAYILMAVVAAYISSMIWLTEGLSNGELNFILGGAGIASGAAFWLVAIWRRRLPEPHQISGDTLG